MAGSVTSVRDPERALVVADPTGSLPGSRDEGDQVATAGLGATGADSTARRSFRGNHGRRNP